MNFIKKFIKKDKDIHGEEIGDLDDYEDDTTADQKEKVKTMKFEMQIDQNGHDDRSKITCICIVLKTQAIYTGGTDALVIEWHHTSSSSKRKLVGHGSVITGLCHSQNTKMRLFSSSADMTIRMWNAGGTCERIFRGHSGVVTSVACTLKANTLESDEWPRLFSASTDGSIREWTCVHLIITQHRGQTIVTQASWPNLHRRGGRGCEMGLRVSWG